MKKPFLTEDLDSWVAFARQSPMSKWMLSVAFLYLFAFFFWIGDIRAQSLVPLNPSPPSSQLATISVNPATFKPQLPYSEELRQIHLLKLSYDSLRTELKTLNELSQDTTLADSALVIAKSRGKAVLDREKQTLETMLANDGIPDAELNAAIGNTISDIDLTGRVLQTADGVPDVAYLMETSEENLKALTNEWVMPKIDQHVRGTLDQGWDPVSGKVSDYFGTGSLPLLETDGSSAEEILTLARENAAGKGRHISDEYLRQVDPEFRKLTFDSLGNIQLTKVQELKETPAFFEANEFTNKNWLERTGLYVWYDPLTPLREGIFVSSGLSFAISQQISIYAGGAIKRQFSSESWPKRQGQGISLGMRVSKDNWAVQANITGSEATLAYPTQRDILNYKGRILSSLLAVGRTVSMGPKIRTVVLVGVDPLYKRERSLSGSAVQIRVGFELEQLSGSRNEK